MNDNDLLVLSGEEGIGKSAMAAKIVEKMAENGYIPFFFWGGTGSYITSGHEIYLHIKKFIEDHPTDRVVLCVDGVDDVTRDDYIAYLRFLPKLGENIKAIISYRENSADMMLGGDLLIKESAYLFRKVKLVELTQLSNGDISKIATGLLNASGKDLSREVERAILGKSCSSIPLYLRILLNRMELVDGEELICLTDNDQINKHFSGIVQGFSDDIQQAVYTMVKECVNKLGVSGYIFEALSLIASSRSGLRQNDICRILCDEKKSDLAITMKDISLIRNYLDVIFNEDFDGIITLKYASIKDIFLEHDTDREEHGNKDLILSYFLNGLDKNDVLRQRDEFYYAMDIWSRRYYKHAMSLMIDISERKNTTQMSDFKYYGWYGHGKRYYDILSTYLDSYSDELKIRFLCFLVDDYFEMYDGSAEELGQIQEMYEKVILDHSYYHDDSCSYTRMIPKCPESDYIAMKSHQIIGYIQERRGCQDKAALEHFKDIFKIGNFQKTDDPDDVKRIIDSLEPKVANIKAVSTESDSSIYDQKKNEVLYETAIQYLVMTKEIDLQTAQNAVTAIENVGLDNCNSIMKDIYVDLQIYLSEMREHDDQTVLTGLEKLAAWATNRFEETRSMRDLINLLKVYASQYDILNESHDEKALGEWQKKVMYLMTPLDHNHEIVNGRVNQKIRRILEMRGCTV